VVDLGPEPPFFHGRLRTVSKSSCERAPAGPAFSPPDEEFTMATRRTTSSKRERERNKQAKAAAKRERRQDRANETESEAMAFDENTASTDELIERIAAMHEQYDAGQISFEAFDEEKTELMALLTARLSE
jgi:hypothetical protein